MSAKHFELIQSLLRRILNGFFKILYSKMKAIAKFSGFGRFKDVGPFSSEDKFRGQLEEQNADDK